MMPDRKCFHALFFCFLMFPNGLFADGIFAGKQIGNIYIGMEVKEAVKVLRSPVSRKVLEKSKMNFFMHILGVAGVGDLQYREMYYLENRQLILLSINGKISGIADLSRQGMLEDAVSLKRGSEAVLVFYGKIGRVMVKQANHRMYAYPRRGIAFFDDGSDGRFDMVIVWKDSNKPIDY